MKTAADYARQALRFALLAGVDADEARKQWRRSYEKGVVSRSLPIITGPACYVREAARNDARHAASLARYARRGELLNSVFDTKEVALGAAKSAARCAGLLGEEL